MTSTASRWARVTLCVSFILLLSGFSARADVSWFTRAWNTDDGLLNDQVDAIVQGPDDYLWIVPPVGLTRFDGVRFSRFPLEDFTGPTDDHICAVLRSSTGTLWLTTYGGTVIGVKPDFSVARIPKGELPAGVPGALAEDAAGALWLAYPHSVCRIQGGQSTEFDLNEGMPPGKFHSLISDAAGRIWLSRGDSICVFQNNQFQRVAHAASLQCLAAGRAGAVWFAAGTHLFRCETNGLVRDFGKIPGLGRPTEKLLFEDQSGAVWIGTDGSGLIRRSEAGFEKIETSYPSILGLAEDAEGNIWAGTDGGGLDRISVKALRLEASGNDSILDPIQSICEDTNGGLWGMDYNGLLMSRTRGLWAPVFTNVLPAETVACLAADSRGAIWIGTRSGQLLRLVGTNPPVLVQQTSHGAIYGLLPASTGDLWIVGYRTLQRLHDEKLEDIKLPCRVERFSAIAEDASGKIWVGGWGVVIRYDGERFWDETPHLPVSGRRVCCLYGTRDGSMWISGGGLGLLRFKDGRATQVGLDQGLFDDYISQIIADNCGWLWFGSDHGIFKIREEELEKAMVDHRRRLRPIGYGRNEGLSSLAALSSTGSPFGFPRAIRTRDGQLWLLTHTGLVTADPRILPERYPSPPVVLTRVAMDGQTVATYGSVVSRQTIADLEMLAGPLCLPPGHRHLEFDFTAFHYRAPENIHLRYQLAGYDPGWIDADTARSASYSRLPAGAYDFRVAACVGDGPWSVAPVTLALVVTPFFWQTWWFRLAVLFLFTLVVIAVVRYISFRRLQAKLRLVEQRAALDRERTRIARDLHDDLGGSLNLAALTLDLTQRESGIGDNLNGKIHYCSTIVRRAARSVDEIVWAINPHNDTLRYLVDYLSQFAVEFLQAADVLCLVELPDHIPDQDVKPEVRHNVLLVVKEALNNIVRHAGAGEVALRVTVSEQQLAISIKDNGRGFEGLPDNSSCDGLRNMRHRMCEIGGEFQLNSRPGEGTHIVLLYSFNS